MYTFIYFIYTIQDLCNITVKFAPSAINVRNIQHNFSSIRSSQRSHTSKYIYRRGNRDFLVCTHQFSINSFLKTIAKYNFFFRGQKPCCKVNIQFRCKYNKILINIYMYSFMSYIHTECKIIFCSKSYLSFNERNVAVHHVLQ